MSKTVADNIEYPFPLKLMLDRALNDTEAFWGEVAEELHWFKRWRKVLDWSYPHFKWFADGKINLSYNCIDRHVEENRGNKAAIIWECGETEQTSVLTYNQLLFKVKQFSSALRSLGVGKGDRVSIYMPMVPEAAIAMLAATRIGAIHSIVFGGFGSTALSDRVTDAGSKVLITADEGYRRGKTIKLKDVVDEALKPPNEVKKVIVLKRGEMEPPMKGGRDIFWDEAVESGKDASSEVEPTDANDLAFILHTSGTTAKPKGIVHVHGGYQVYIYAMGKWVYDMGGEDVWWSTSDIGWIVGHSYVVYGPLLTGCSTIMYEGVPDYPQPDVWWKIIEKNRVTQLWISPTGVRGLMKCGDEWHKPYNLSSLRLVACAGEVLNPPAWEWLQKRVLKDQVPVIDHMWQTESGGPMIGNPYGINMLPVKPGSSTIPLPGIDADIVDDHGNSLPPRTKGHFVCRRPFPGLTPTIWNDDERYVQTYWSRISNCYYTGDAAERDESGYYYFMGRMDEVIKIAGHRIGTIEIESALVSHPDVAEAAVVGKPDQLRGEIASGFVVLKTGREPSEILKKELLQSVRTALGPIVILEVNFAKILPKTRSGKILRRLIKAVITNQPLGDYSTIEEAASLQEIEKAADELRRSIK